MLVKEAIGTGETVVLAQRAACKMLGVETHEAEFEILQMPVKKTLGLFGGKEAKVRAFIKVSAADEAQRYIQNIVDAMGLSAIEIEKKEKEEGAVFNITGEDVGYLIGRRGETLDALQYLTGLVANHVENTYYRITINTGDYREKRERTLESLGNKIAKKVLKTGRQAVLEPMNPYERRIIHTSVQRVKGVTSWSEGEDTNRHVVIALDSNKRISKTDLSAKKEKTSKRSVEQVNSKPAGTLKEKNESKKTIKKMEQSEAPLYGKIELKN